MKVYSEIYAELYDLFYSRKPYKPEALFIHQCFNDFGHGEIRNILEIACGTGSHSIEFDKLGYKIDALDISEDMISFAIKKAENAKARNVEFYVQDMVSLSLEKEKFDAAVCLFDSIGYALTDENIIRTLKGIHSTLKTKGLFIFEFWHAPAMIRSYDPLRIVRIPGEEYDVLRISETSLNIPEQHSEVRYTIYRHFHNGSYDTHNELHRNRFFSLKEMSTFLRMAGFNHRAYFDGFSKESEINIDTWHILAVAQKA